MGSIGDLFVPGADRSPPRFNDRVPQCTAFDDSLARHERLVASGAADPTDLQAPRENVLVFYGYGGIGKTTLSRHLARRATGEASTVTADWPDPPEFEGATGVAVWQVEDGPFDLERFVLGLRISLLDAGVSAPAFDLALSRYWSEVHPDQDLSAFLRSHRGSFRSDRTLDLPGLLRDVVDDLSAQLGSVATTAGIVYRGGAALAAKLAEARRRGLAIGRCPRLENFLADPIEDDHLVYMPNLLAWDLHQAQREDAVRIVVFLDRFEAAQRQRTTEQALRRIAFLVPNALFVVTGRARLRWEDPGRFSGVDVWPRLADDDGPEPRQHLVGRLDDADAAAYVAGFRDASGHHMVPPTVQREIVAAAGGWPLYLRMATDHFLRTGDRDALADRHPDSLAFPALVDRVLDGTDARTQRLLRTASILPGFDAELLQEVADVRDEGPVLHFLDTPFVEATGSGIHPYRIHDELATTVAMSDRPRGNGWSQGDWTRVARQAIGVLTDRMQAATTEGVGLRAIRLLIDGLHVAERTGLEGDDVAELALLAYDAGAWSTLLADELADRSPERPATSLAAVRQLFSAIGMRARAGNEQSLAWLEPVVASDLLPEPLRAPADVFRGLLFRQLGHWSAALLALDPIADGDGPFAPIAEHHRLCVVAARGDLGDALDRLASAGDDHEELVGLRGDLRFRHGRFQEAARDLTTARELAREDGRPGHVALWDAVLAMTLGFHLGPAAAGQIAAVEQHQALDGRLTVRCYGGVGLVLGGLVEKPYDHLEEIRREARSRNAVEFAVVANVAELVLRLRNDADPTPAWHRLVEEHDPMEGPSPWVEISAWLTDRDLPDDLPRVRWEGGPAQVAAAWQSTVRGV